MKDIEKDIEKFLQEQFVCNNKLTPMAFCMLLFFAITFPFYWLYLKIKYLFVKRY